MAKKDFTQADRNKYSGIIGGIDTTDTTSTINTENTTTTTERRHYNRLDPRDEAPKEYRFTARMPGEYGRFLNELAYQRRSTITAELQRLVKEEMEKHPEILASLDELND
jgi:hypothetical protein